MQNALKKKGFLVCKDEIQKNNSYVTQLDSGYKIILMNFLQNLAIKPETKFALTY